MEWVCFPVVEIAERFPWPRAWLGALLQLAHNKFGL
jgi:hypothetical protein